MSDETESDTAAQESAAVPSQPKKRDAALDADAHRRATDQGVHWDRYPLKKTS